MPSRPHSAPSSLAERTRRPARGQREAPGAGLAAAIRQLRRTRGLTQAWLADAAALTRTQLVRVELGQVEADEPTLGRLCRALGFPHGDALLEAAAASTKLPARARIASAAPRTRTAAAFAEWASSLTLDNGQRWQLEPFQLAFIEDVLAGRPENWMICPEGQGKTTLVAGFALWMLQHSEGALIPVAASSREQAEVLYRQAAGFVQRSPGLDRIFRCLPGNRQIRLIAQEGAQLAIFAADDRTGDGLVPYPIAILEEMHRHRNLKLLETWSGKLSKRGAQLIVISTAGSPGSDFEILRAAIRERATLIERRETFTRAVSEQLVLHEWAVPEGGDPEDIALVKQANPFSGITEESLRRKRNSPTMSLQHWRRFTCGIPTRDVDSAITEVEWADALSDEVIPAGEPIIVGLDVGWRFDTTALVPLYATDREHQLLGPATILVPPRDGRSLDPNEIEQAILAMHERNPISVCVMDVTRAEQLATWIRDTTGAEVIEWPQSNSFAALDYERFTEGLRQGWLKHTGDPQLTKHVLNAVTRMLPDGRSRFERPSTVRQNAGEQEVRVIDALVSAAMAVAWHVGSLSEIENETIEVS